MVAPFTAFDLVRVMDHEMNHNHEKAARRGLRFRRRTVETRVEPAHASGETSKQHAHRRDGGSLFSRVGKSIA